MTLVPASSHGGSSGSQTLTNLGLLDAVSLLSGPQTVLSPAAGSLVEPFVSDVSFIALDQNYDVNIARAADIIAAGVSTPFLLWTNGVYSGSNIAGPTNTFKFGIVDSGVLKAVITTQTNAYAVLSTPPVWQANHLYPAAITLITGPDSHIWSQSSGGTSGGTIPNFAGNEGGTVADNTVTWTDEGAIPAAGKLQVYARVTGAS